MPQVQLGDRHECSECGTKFYDLGQPTAVCPKCQTEQEPEKAEKPKKPARRKKAAADSGGSAAKDSAAKD
jgi:hypothetical protein